MKASKVPDIVYFSHHNSFVEVSNFKKIKNTLKFLKSSVLTLLMAKSVINHTCMTMCVSYFHHSNMLHWNKSLSYMTIFVTHLNQEIEIHHQV